MGRSLIMMPVHRPSLCTSLTGVKCVCRVSGCDCSGWLSLYSTLSVVKCVFVCSWWGGGRGLRLCCLWIGFLYVTTSDG